MSIMSAYQVRQGGLQPLGFPLECHIVHFNQPKLLIWVLITTTLKLPKYKRLSDWKPLVGPLDNIL